MDDLRHVGIDLTAVPLDEVLDFRRQYGSEYRAYSRDIRRFISELLPLSETDQGAAFMDRRAELDDRAAELRRIGRRAFRYQAISLGFGIAGAAWTLSHGDVWAAVFAAGSAAAGLSTSTSARGGAPYTYILRAKAQLAR